MGKPCKSHGLSPSLSFRAELHLSSLLLSHLQPLMELVSQLLVVVVVVVGDLVDEQFLEAEAEALLQFLRPLQFLLIVPEGAGAEAEVEGCSLIV